MRFKIVIYKIVDLIEPIFVGMEKVCLGMEVVCEVMEACVEYCVDLFDHYQNKRDIRLVEDLLLAHIYSREHLSYFNEEESEQQNISNMINFYEVALKDGYYYSGNYYGASKWMSRNPDKVLEMYYTLKEKLQK